MNNLESIESFLDLRTAFMKGSYSKASGDVKTTNHNPKRK